MFFKDRWGWEWGSWKAVLLLTSKFNLYILNFRLKNFSWIIFEVLLKYFQRNVPFPINSNANSTLGFGDLPSFSDPLAENPFHNRNMEWNSNSFKTDEDDSEQRSQLQQNPIVIYPGLYSLKPTGQKIQELGDQAMKDIQNLQSSNIFFQISFC